MLPCVYRVLVRVASGCVPQVLLTATAPLVTRAPCHQHQTWCHGIRSELGVACVCVWGVPYGLYGISSRGTRCMMLHWSLHSMDGTQVVPGTCTNSSQRSSTSSVGRL